MVCAAALRSTETFSVTHPRLVSGGRCGSEFVGRRSPTYHQGPPRTPSAVGCSTRQGGAMADIKTRHYLLDQGGRRFTPTLNNILGMGVVAKRVLAHPWKTKVLAKPPVGSD